MKVCSFFKYNIDLPKYPFFIKRVGELRVVGEKRVRGHCLWGAIKHIHNQNVIMKLTEK